MNRDRAYWLIYAGAWVPYALSYFVIFVAQADITSTSAAVSTLDNILPAAVLGIGVMQVCDHLPWGSRRYRHFWWMHLVCALTYALLWWILILLALSFRVTV